MTATFQIDIDERPISIENINREITVDSNVAPVPLPPSIGIYVSNSGDDTATGVAGAPVKTWSQALALASAGDTIKFEYGGEWREAVDLLGVSDVYLGAYGDPADGLPIINGCDLAGTWVSEGGNVWSQSWTHEAAASGRIRVFNSDTKVQYTRVATLTANDQYLVDGNADADMTSSPQTVKIYSDTDPNAKNLEITKRLWAIRLIDDGVCDWLEGHGSGSADGPLFVQGERATVRNCVASGGAKHSIFAEGECNFEDIVVWHADAHPSGSTNATITTFNTASSTNKPTGPFRKVGYIDNDPTQPRGNSEQDSFMFAHTNDAGTLDWAHVGPLEDCWAVGGGETGRPESEFTYWNNFYGEKCREFSGPKADTTIVFENLIWNGYATVRSQANVEGLMVMRNCVLLVPGTLTNLLWLLQGVGELELDHCMVIGNGNHWLMDSSSATTCKVTANHCLFYQGRKQISVANGTFVGGNNLYYTAGDGFQVHAITNAGTLTSLSAWESDPSVEDTGSRWMTDAQAAAFFSSGGDPTTDGDCRVLKTATAKDSSGTDQTTFGDGTPLWTVGPENRSLLAFPKVPKTRAEILDYLRGIKGPWHGKGQVVWIDRSNADSERQDRLNYLTDVNGATDEHVLTKDTATGNTVFKAAAGGVAATTTTAGIAELATVAETSTGTDTGRTVTPDGLAGSVHGEKSVTIVSVESGTAVTTGDGTIAWTVPAQVNGMDLVQVVCSVHTKGITGTTDVQVRRRRAGVDADMLSVKVTIGDEFFASDETIDTANDDVQTGDQIYVDVDAIHSGTAPNGLSTTLTFRTP